MENVDQTFQKIIDFSYHENDIEYFKSIYEGTGVKYTIDEVAGYEEIRGLIPVHPRCLIDKQVPIYTSKGWKAIGNIKIGDLVLTHKGNFKKVLNVFVTPKQNPEVVKVSIGNSFHQRYTFTVTSNHPILINNKWVEAGRINIGDKISMLSRRCENCENLIPYYKKYCSFSCNSKVITKKQWANKKHRVNMSHKISVDMLNSYNDGRRDRFKVTNNANIKNKELILKNEHVFQNPETNKKAQQSLGKRNYGKNWLEEKFGWMLKQFGIKFKPQYAIKYGKDSLSRDRYFFIDFALLKNKIAIECDGSYWHKDKNRDIARQKIIEKLGWTVLRFSEEEIKNDLIGCGVQISRVLMNHNKEYLFGEYDIKKIEKWKLRKPRTLYNIEIKDDNSYIVKGFVVHNCRCTWLPVVGNPIIEQPIKPEDEMRGHLESVTDSQARNQLIEDAKSKGIDLSSREAANIINNGVDNFTGSMNCTEIRKYQNFAKELGHDPTVKEWLTKENLVAHLRDIESGSTAGKIIYQRTEEFLANYKNQSEMIEKFIKISPNFKNEQGLFRGIRLSTEEKLAFNKIEIGKVIDLKGTSSFSSVFDQAHNFSGNNGVMFVIKEGADVKNMSSVYYVSKSPNEFEVLASKDLKFKVTNIINTQKLADIPEVANRIDNISKYSDEVYKIQNNSLGSMPVSEYSRMVEKAQREFSVEYGKVQADLKVIYLEEIK